MLHAKAINAMALIRGSDLNRNVLDPKLQHHAVRPEIAIATIGFQDISRL
jgi:hypothetical protein